MDSAIYLMGSRMDALAENLQLIAANLANANTPGFKRTTWKFAEVLQALAPQLGGGIGAPGVVPEWSSLTVSGTDFSPGAIRMTGSPLDLAIRGSGFFVLDTADGPRYTRKGRLHLNAAGELTDAAGNRFVADSGSLRVPETASEIAVSRDGEVLADDELIGRLQLVDIPDPQYLVAVGWGLYRNDGPAPGRSFTSEIIQGAVEGSNVNVLNEMVSLVQVMRAYEATARILKRLDSLNGQLVRSAA